MPYEMETEGGDRSRRDHIMQLLGQIYQENDTYCHAIIQGRKLNINIQLEHLVHYHAMKHTSSEMAQRS